MEPQLDQLWILTITGALWAILLYGIVLLAFGISPAFPPLVAISIGLLLATVVIYLLPRWTMSSNWQPKHVFFIIFGTMLGSMMAGFIGFIGAAQVDLYFKMLVDVLAIIFMLILGFRMNTVKT